ncbi:hypothetical protein GTW68_16555 [Streptomyces sp. SID4945]|nr:hypothetical protein [Streptomyces sp. SID4945]
MYEADPLTEFDTETLALLEAVEVPLLKFSDLDLDVAFGTPMEMYDLVTTDELARWDAVSTVKGRARARDEVVADSGARRDAARDILAADPTVTELVRERFVDILIPAARQLRIDHAAVIPFAELGVLAA